MTKERSTRQLVDLIEEEFTKQIREKGCVVLEADHAESVLSIFRGVVNMIEDAKKVGNG